MDRIARLVEQLHSPKKDDRYEACEWLRVAPSLPQTALEALEQATHDPDKLVADAATQAIAVHTGSDAPPSLVPSPPRLRWERLAWGAAAAIASFTLVMALTTTLGMWYETLHCLIFWTMGAPIAVLLGFLSGGIALQPQKRTAMVVLWAAVGGIAFGIVFLVFVALL